MQQETAQAAVEFLLILPFFIFFMLLLIDFGMLTFQYVSVANGVREGARWGSVNCAAASCTAADLQTRTVARSGGILTDPAEVTAEWVDWNLDGAWWRRGDSVVVRVNHPYIMLFVPGATIPVISCAEMRLEREASGGAGLPPGASCAS